MHSVILKIVNYFMRGRVHSVLVKNQLIPLVASHLFNKVSKQCKFALVVLFYSVLVKCKSFAFSYQETGHSKSQTLVYIEEWISLKLSRNCQSGF